MKKLEIIIRPERLDDLKTILNSNGAHGLICLLYTSDAADEL